MMFDADLEIAPEKVIPIVVGVHLRAEIGDRLRGESLKKAITNWKKGYQLSESPWPLVCTDMWYLNQAELRIQPTVCIGSPEVNAATTAISSRLSTVILKDEEYRIQADPSYVDLKCCMWGTNEHHSDTCLDVFISKIMPLWLGAFFGFTVEN